MIQTYSTFYFGKTITSENNSMIVKEGSDTISVVVPSGNYSMTSLAQTISSVLNFSSLNNIVYSVIFNRTSRTMTVGSSSIIDIDNQSGASPLLTLLGFNQEYYTGITAITSQQASTVEYSPQFLLQDYVPSSKNATMISASELISASGRTQVVRFGLKREVRFNIRWANDYVSSIDGWIKQNLSAVKELNDFMLHCVEKNIIEFMPDIDDKQEFERMILVSTETSSDGTAYLLNERYDQDTPDYYDSGILTFRLVEA
jgi:hypothetical protein